MFGKKKDKIKSETKSKWNLTVDEYNNSDEIDPMVECYRPDLKQKQKCIISVRPKEGIILLQTEDNVAIGCKLEALLAAILLAENREEENK